MTKSTVNLTRDIRSSNGATSQGRRAEGEREGELDAGVWRVLLLRPVNHQDFS